MFDPNDFTPLDDPYGPPAKKDNPMIKINVWSVIEVFKKWCGVKKESS